MREYKNIIAAVILGASVIIAALIIGNAIQSGSGDIAHGIVNAVSGL